MSSMLWRMCCIVIRGTYFFCCSIHISCRSLLFSMFFSFFFCQNLVAAPKRRKLFTLIGQLKLVAFSLIFFSTDGALWSIGLQLIEFFQGPLQGLSSNRASINSRISFLFFKLLLSLNLVMVSYCRTHYFHFVVVKEDCGVIRK